MYLFQGDWYYFDQSNLVTPEATIPVAARDLSNLVVYQSQVTGGRVASILGVVKGRKSLLFLDLQAEAAEAAVDIVWQDLDFGFHRDDLLIAGNFEQSGQINICNSIINLPPGVSALGAYPSEFDRDWILVFTCQEYRHEYAILVYSLRGDFLGTLTCKALNQINAPILIDEQGGGWHSGEQVEWELRESESNRFLFRGLPGRGSPS